MSDQVPESFRAGSLVAGYRLEERIGSGGMAAVFRAYDGRLGRYVALKILAPGLTADEAFRQRFVRELRTAAAVDDPHAIPVFDWPESAPRPWYWPGAGTCWRPAGTLEARGILRGR